MSHRRRLMALATAVTAAALALAPAGPAVAAPPGDCHFSWTNSSGTAICLSASSFRVYIVCTHAGAPYTVYGPAVGRAGTSTASCRSGDLLKNLVRPNQTVYADVDV